MGKKEQSICTGIDIGTHSIKIVVGQQLLESSLQILGFSEVPSLKMRKGEIEDAAFILGQLQLALSQAESECGLDLSRLPVYVALSGHHLHTVNNTVRVQVKGAGSLVCESDLVAATELANNMTVPEEQLPVHNYIRFHRLDDGRELLNALGQGSQTLEVELQSVLGNHQRINTTCGMVANALGVRPAAAIYTPLAVGCASSNDQVLTEGNLSIDLGAGTTSYAILSPLGCLQCGQYTIGCEQIANDLAIAFQTTIESGRKIVRELATLGCAVNPGGSSRPERQINLGRGRSGRSISSRSVENIIELRLRELFELLHQDLLDNDTWKWVGGELLLSGGGALLPGVLDLAQSVFRRPTRLARPFQVSGSASVIHSPQFVTAIGLLRCGPRDLQIQQEQGLASATKLSNSVKMIKNVLGGLFNW